MSNLYYKVVEKYPEENLIVVRYWTDLISELDLMVDGLMREDGVPVRCRTDVSINLPIPAPTGSELDKFLIRSGPIAWLKMMEQVKDPYVDTSIDHVIENYYNVPKSVSETDLEQIMSPTTNVDIIQSNSVPPQPDPTYIYNPLTNTWEAP
jgi:hypothetical protein